MDKNILTKDTKISKLVQKAEELKSSGYTGQLILVVNLNMGGVTNLTEFKRSDS